MDNRSKPVLMVISILCLWASAMEAQGLEVEGIAKITAMNAASSSAQNVAVEPDGTLVVGVAQTTYAIGDFAHGGVVFSITPSGTHGRVVSIYNMAEVSWSNLATSIGKSVQSDVNGAGNSVAITLQSGHENSAAKQCLELAFAGYDDWYLPAKDELNQIFLNKAVIDATAIANGGEAFASAVYWSSTELSTDITEAWNQNFFGTGTQQGDIKTALFHARAVRSF